jgi:hypothetical protein
VIAAEAARHLPAVEAGQHEIEQHHQRPNLRRRLIPARAVVCLDDAVPGVFKDEPRDRSAIVVVVDDEDDGRIGRWDGLLMGHAMAATA